MKTLKYAVGLLVALPGHAMAIEPGGELRAREVRVPYADLDLRTVAGLKTLDRRLARAVKLVCPDTRGSVFLASKRAARHCIAETTAKLASQRNHAVAEQVGWAMGGH
jgi:UrcA family protein